MSNLLNNTILLYFLSFILNFGHWIVYMFCVPRMLHIMQLEGYHYKDYIRWLSRNFKKAFWPCLKQFMVCGLFYAMVKILNKTSDTAIIIAFYGMFVLFYIMNLLQIISDRREMKSAKKRLAYTPRAKRLLFWNFILMIVLDASFIRQAGISIYFYYSLFILMIPVSMIFANFMAWPTEQLVNDYYISSARRKLKKKEYRGLIRIGITGSYGKTSSKFILKTILSEKYNVLATPESYNTTMGNVRVIREQLKPEHEVFISEMGARYPHDIAEICEFVRPQIGLITSIGPQHLETFKTIDKIVSTKAELIRSMDANGVVILPRDNEYCQKLYQEEKRKKYCYTMKGKNADVYAKNITLDEKGSNFIAVTKIGEIKCQARLLGEHNIENILGAIAIAVHLGLSKEQIEAGVAKIEPVPHRLQMLDNTNGTIVIDDAFNSNPVGAKMALDVLKSFKGRKIIVTPGMVELGESEKEENKKFGRHMADCTDIAILIGVKRSEPIVEGLREGNFDEMNLHVVANLDGATKKLAEISKLGDVILFENDLPDNYDE